MDIDYKKQVDDFVERIPEGLEYETLNLGVKQYLAIKEFIVDGKYKNLTVKVDGEMPQHLIFTTPKPTGSKFHS